MGRRLQQLLREHAGDVHACFARALDAMPGLHGELLVRFFVRPDGAIERADVLKDQVGSRILHDCLEASIGSWRAPDLASDEPSEFVFPLIFEPDDADDQPKSTAARSASPPPRAPLPTPAVVAAAPPPRPKAPPPQVTPLPPPVAVAQRGRYVVPLSAGLPGPLGQGKVEARVLIDEQTVGPTQASLTQIVLHPRARLALHLHPGSTELLYVQKGVVRVRSGVGEMVIANAGDLIVAPAGLSHNIEAPPFVAATLLQFFVVAGPEHAYRDSSDRRGTVPVARPERRTTPIASAASESAVAVVHASDASAYPLAGGGEVSLFLDGKLSGRVALERLDAPPGASIPVHAHDSSDELLFILSGHASMSVGDVTLEVGPGDAVRLPAGAVHAVRVGERLVAVQCYAPAGPEQRFKTSPRSPSNSRPN